MPSTRNSSYITFFIREIMNRMRNMKNNILAIRAAVLASTPNPSTAATIATRRKTSAIPNIPISLIRALYTQVVVH